MNQKTCEQQVLDALPGTIPQIIKRSGVSRPTVYLWIGRLRKRSAIHIRSWRRTSGQPAPYYAIGPGSDAKRPANQTKAEYSRRHYLKHRRDVLIEERAIRREARANASAMAKKPQSWLSALGVV